VDRSTALALLPETYRRLLAMLDAGCPTNEIAEALGVEATSLPALVVVGNAKLEAAMAAPPAGGGDLDRHPGAAPRR